MVQRQGANTVQEMMYSLTLRKEAELDIGEQFDFYEEKRDLKTFLRLKKP